MAATNTTAPSTAPSKTQAPFRILDLPSELREHVYADAIDHTSQRAAKIRYSALTRVSRQVRGEALPVFFAESNFIIDVGTNFALLESILNPREFPRRWRELSGVPLLKPAGKRLFQDRRTSAIFRDVSFHVHSAVKVVIDWYKRENGIEEALCVINFRVRQSKVDVEVVPGKGHPKTNPGAFTAKQAEFCDGMVDAVIKAAKEAGPGENFEGFKIEDLENIARAFRI